MKFGNCCAPGDTNNAAIEAQIRQDRDDAEHEVKLLLLGAGESGKSTIVKQMKIIHKDGFSLEERVKYKTFVLRNIAQCTSQLVEGVHRLGLPWNGQLAELQEELFPRSEMEEADEHSLTPERFELIAQLWDHPSLREAWDRRSEIQVNDSAAYFMNKVNVMSQDEYIPNVQDILRTRVRTTGIQETRFAFGGLQFVLVDVGGQRNERKKWIHCFEGVTAVIFCCALSEYDQKLFEDEGINRMTESLALFDEICNSQWFAETAIILFLNKTDIFQEKLSSGVNIDCCWPDYTGGRDFSQCVEFIKNKFYELNKSSIKSIYPHLTQATDTNNIKFVFVAVKDIILQNNLRLSGFL